MKVKVDQDTCTGCGLCVSSCPEVFEMTGDTATEKSETVPSSQEEFCREAAQDCPVEAISVEE